MSGKFSVRAALVAASLAGLAALQVTSAQDPSPATGRFNALAQDCKEERMEVLREPGANDTDLTIRVEVFEHNDFILDEIPTRACGVAALKEACKTNPGGFATAVEIKQNGQIFEGLCSK